MKTKLFAALLGVAAVSLTACGGSYPGNQPADPTPDFNGFTVYVVHVGTRDVNCVVGYHSLSCDFAHNAD